MSTIDEVKQRLDIVEVISRYTPLTKSGRYLKALCPFHSEKSPSFFVYPEQQSWHCFGACSTGGDVFSFIMKKENLDFAGALRLLAERVGVALPSRRESSAASQRDSALYRANEAAAQYFHELLHSPAGERAREHLLGRAISPQTMSDFLLGCSPGGWEALKQHLTGQEWQLKDLLAAGLVIASEDGKSHDRFRNRLMFPIADAHGHITGFGARALDDSQPKYLNSPQTAIFDKSGSLYAIHRASAAIRQADQAIIVEGYMDAITAHQYDCRNVVASLGTAITAKQLGDLKKLTRNIVLALDPDAAGEEAMLRCASYEEALEIDIKVARMPAGKDPDEVIKDDKTRWQALIADAVPMVDYVFGMVTARLDMSKLPDRSSAVEQLLPLVDEITNIVRRAHYLQKLARLAQVDLRALESMLRKNRAELKKRLEPVKELRKILARPREEYCLALLLQNPELGKKTELVPDYFECSENRAVLTAWQESGDLATIKDRLDAVLFEHLDSLVQRRLYTDQVESKFEACLQLLKIEHLRNLAMKRSLALSNQPEMGRSHDLDEKDVEIGLKHREYWKRIASSGR